VKISNKLHSWRNNLKSGNAASWRRENSQKSMARRKKRDGIENASAMTANAAGQLKIVMMKAKPISYGV
jgi:hypothetical protein